MERETLFATRNVRRVYGDVTAVDHVSVDVKSGEWVFLVGENGAGKSTLLRLLTREETLNAGQVFYRGRDISRFHGRDLAQLRREVAVIWQDLRLIPNKTVRENISFALEVRGMGKHDISRLTEHVLELVNMHGRGDRFPNQLSGGEQQRVAIARALVVPPKVLIADEPTSNLSPPQREQLISILAQDFTTTSASRWWSARTMSRWWMCSAGACWSCTVGASWETITRGGIRRTCS